MDKRQRALERIKAGRPLDTSVAEKVITAPQAGDTTTAQTTDAVKPTETTAVKPVETTAPVEEVKQNDTTVATADQPIGRAKRKGFSKPLDEGLTPAGQTQTTKIAAADPVIDSNFLASQPIDTIVDMMISGKVKNSDLETIYQSDPMRYEEIKAKTGKKQQESIINQKKTDYVKSLDEVTNKIDSVKVEGGAEAKKRYQDSMNTPEIKQLRADITSVGEKIAEFDDQLEYLVDDLVEENPGASALLISALSSKARKELVRERNGLIAEQSLKVNAANQLIAQAQQEFQIYQQAETEKRNYEIGKISQKLGIDAQKMTIEVGALEKGVAEFDSILSGIATAKSEDVKFQRELYKDQLVFSRDLEKIDIQFENDIYKDKINADREFSYEKVLKSMDIESRFAISDMEYNQQLSILRIKDELDKSGVDWQFQKMDDGTIMAIDKNDPTNQKVIGRNGAVGGNYLEGIGTGKIMSYGGEHDGYRGIDIDGKIGDPIPAIGGKVVKVVSGQGKSSKPSYGNYVDVQDANGNIHRYAHLNSVNVSVGDEIPYGASVGGMGNSGYTIAGPNGDGSHLDYSIKKADGSWFNAKQIPGYIATIQPKEQMTKEQESLRSSINGIKSEIELDSKGFNRAVGTRGAVENFNKWRSGEGENGFAIGGSAGGFASKVQQLKSLLTLPELKYLKGPTSDKDILFIQAAATTLSTDMTEKDFTATVDELEKIMVRNFGPGVSISDFGEGNTTPASAYLVK